MSTTTTTTPATSTSSSTSTGAKPHAASAAHWRKLRAATRILIVFRKTATATTKAAPRAYRRAHFFFLPLETTTSKVLLNRKIKLFQKIINEP